MSLGVAVPGVVAAGIADGVAAAVNPALAGSSRHGLPERWMPVQVSLDPSFYFFPRLFLIGLTPIDFTS